MAVFPSKAKEEPQSQDPHVLMELPELKRLALQGQRMAARELVSRNPDCASISAFLEDALDATERARLSGGQFNVLHSAWSRARELEAEALLDTLELPAVPSNLTHGYGTA